GSFQQRGRNDGKVWYNSMQVGYQVRGAAGMNLTFAYTYSKMIEQAALSNSFMGAGTSAFTDTQQQIPQRSVYAFDRPHVVKMDSNGNSTPQPYSSSYGCGTDPSTYNFLFVPSSLYAPRISPLHFSNIRLHAVPQVDMSVNKTTQITEHTSVQFRAEAFNIMNTFYLPIQQFTNNLDDNNFGSI